MHAVASADGVKRGFAVNGKFDYDRGHFVAFDDDLADVRRTKTEGAEDEESLDDEGCQSFWPGAFGLPDDCTSKSKLQRDSCNVPSFAEEQDVAKEEKDGRLHGSKNSPTVFTLDEDDRTPPTVALVDELERQATTVSDEDSPRRKGAPRSMTTVFSLDEDWPRRFNL